MRGPLLALVSLVLAVAATMLAAAALLPRVAVAPPARSAPAPTAAATVAAATAAPRPTVEGMRIVVPRLGIDLPLREGDIQRDIAREGFAGDTPEGSAFHLPGTAVPGELGNSYIYAHARPGMFLALWQARVGDRVVIRLPYGAELEYVVAEIHPRVPPDDVRWVRPTPDERLTLQTSTGPSPGDPRFVVVARPAR